MTLNKKILATAIVGGLLASAVQAQVNLSPVAPAPVVSTRVAAEATFPAVLDNGNPAFDIAVAARYNFSTGEIRHGRLECSNFRFEGATIAIAGAGTTTTAGSVNGLGSNAIFFSLTSGAAAADRILSTSTITFDINNGSQILANAPVNCTFGIYDTASQASVGGSNGLITASVSSGRFIDVAQSYGYARALQTAVATVNFTPIFNFITSGSVAQPAFVIGTRTARIGFFRFNTVNALDGAVAQPLLPTGAPSSLATLLGANTAHVIEGDFSNAANADGTFTGDALARVFLDSDANCDRSNGTVINATSLTATSATFVTGNIAVSAFGACYTSRAGEIPESAYAIRLVPQAFGSTVSPGPVSTNLGSIARDGTTLQAPLVQIPAGWLSRIALTNTSSVPRPFTITVQGETGNTISTAASNLTGTIPARGTTVIDVPSVITGFTGATRATINVAIAAPTTQVQGLYQIVNPASGSISNHVMVRPGSN